MPDSSAPRRAPEAGELAALRQRVAELERAARRDQMALRVSRIGTWTRDMVSGLVEWSPELIELFGLTPETYPRSHEAFLEYLHPDDQAHFMEGLESAIASQAEYSVDFRFRHASGKYRWMCGRGRGFYDAQGRLLELAGVGIEITAQKRAEEALTGHERQLRQIGDNLPDGALYQLAVDREGKCRFVYWSAGIERLVGVPVEEILRDPKSLYAQVHPEDVAALAEDEARCQCDRRVFDRVARLRHRETGEWRWVHLRSGPRTLPDGTTLWDGVYFDITRGKQVEEALSRSMERFNLAQRAGGIGVFDWDVQTNAVVWNEEEQRLFGLEPGAFEGRLEGWARRVDPSDLPRVQGELQKAMAEHREELHFDFRIIRPDGQLRWIEGAGRFFYDAEGRPLRMVGVNLDVTGRKEAGRKAP